jgi:ParB family chromosome partitioning protein
MSMSTAKHRALGRGLSSLIPQPKPPSKAPETPARPDSGLLQLDIDRIRPCRAQPRQDFDQAALEELARSIAQDGVLQPVIVKPAGNGAYELIAGERRWRAAQIAGLLKVPALVREVEDARLLQLALIENLQREDLNPIEAAMGFRALIDDLGLTQQEVADRVGKQRATVANALRLLALPGPVQERVRKGSVSPAHAKVLAALESPQHQIRLAERVEREGLTVKQLESLARKTVPGELEQVRIGSRRDPNVVAAEERLSLALGTKVEIVQRAGKSRGRIEIHFFGDEERDRIYEALLSCRR